MDSNMCLLEQERKNMVIPGRAEGDRFIDAHKDPFGGFQNNREGGWEKESWDSSLKQVTTQSFMIWALM